MAGLFGNNIFKNGIDGAGSLLGLVTDPIGSIEHLAFVTFMVIVGSIIGFKLLSKLLDKI